MIDEIIERLQYLSVSQQEEILNNIKSMLKEDQRGYQRKRIETEIDIASDDIIIQTSTLDISASGVYADTKENIAVNQEVTIVLNLKGISYPLKLSGKIVRADENGIGIEFQNIGSHLKELIDSVLWKGIEY